jgi:outer membrane protein assembly factor BamB
MKTFRNSLGILFIACVLGGCAAFSWLPWVDRTPAEDAPARLESLDASVDLRKQWSARIGRGLGKKYLRLAPVVLADRIYAADAYGHVEARDRFTGERLWHTRIGDPDQKGFITRMNRLSRRDPSFVGGLGAGEGLVLVGTMNAEVIALSAADGSERWRRTVSSEVLSAPAASSGTVFVLTLDGRLAGYDASNGRERWTYDTSVPILTLRGTSRPVVAGGGVFAGFPNGKVGVFRERSGEPIWEHRVSLPQGRSELDRIIDADTSPLPSGTAVFAANYQGRLKALRPQDGSVLWERDASTYLDLAEGQGRIYLVDDRDVVKAMRQQSGELAWEQTGLLRRGLSSPVVVGSSIVVTDREGYVHVLSQSDGRFLGRTRVDRSGVRSPAVTADGMVYVLGNRGTLVAFSIEPR